MPLNIVKALHFAVVPEPAVSKAYGLAGLQQSTAHSCKEAGCKGFIIMDEHLSKSFATCTTRVGPLSGSLADASIKVADSLWTSCAARLESILKEAAYPGGRAFKRFGSHLSNALEVQWQSSNPERVLPFLQCHCIRQELSVLKSLLAHFESACRSQANLVLGCL